MFVRLKHRGTKEGTQKTYAYVVASRYTKRGPRQRVKKYLGRVHVFQKQKTMEWSVRKTFLGTIEEMIINELKMHGFQKKKEGIWQNKGVYVDMQLKVIKDDAGNNICIAINQGILCSYTLNQLFHTSCKHKENKKLGKWLGKALIEAGLSIKPNDFLQLFNLIAECQTMINNAKQ